jgi:5'-AMP-activated protein kinase, regulatory gamma subunit
MLSSAKLSTKRRPSTRIRATSHAPLSQESHDNALAAIRSFLKGHTAYDAFPVSFRLIVLDTKLNVKKALQCLLLNGVSSPLVHHLIHLYRLGPRRRISTSMEQ